MHRGHLMPNTWLRRHKACNTAASLNLISCQQFRQFTSTKYDEGVFGVSDMLVRRLRGLGGRRMTRVGFQICEMRAARVFVRAPLSVCR